MVTDNVHTISITGSDNESNLILESLNSSIVVT